MSFKVIATDSQGFTASHDLQLTIEAKPTYNQIIGTSGDDNSLRGTDGDDHIMGLAGNDKIYGGKGNDILDGGAGNDYIKGSGTLIGGDGHDYLEAIEGTGGDNIFYGGKGNDYILMSGRVGMENKTFYFNLEDGQDFIQGMINQGSEHVTNRFVFGEGITSDMVSFGFSTDQGGYSYVRFFVGNQGDEMRFIARDLFMDGDKRTLRFEFFDGTVWEDVNHAFMLGRQKTLYLGTNQSDVFEGALADETFITGDGDDVVVDYAGWNHFDGGNGSDILMGVGEFTGGKGNDYIALLSWFSGMEGVAPEEKGDIIHFNLGDGQDIISYAANSGSEEYFGPIEMAMNYGMSLEEFEEMLKEFGYSGSKLIFGADVLSSMVTFHQDNNDLVITVGSNGDQVKVKDYFYGGIYQSLNQIEFADGTVWGAEDIKQMLPIMGTSGDDILQGTDANDIIYAMGGNDYLVGGKGSDTYVLRKEDKGHVTINNFSESAKQDHDVVHIQELAQMGADMWGYHKEGNDYIFQFNRNAIGGWDSSIRIENYFLGEQYKIDGIQFGDRFITAAQIDSKFKPITPPTDPDPPPGLVDPGFDEELLFSASLSFGLSEESFLIEGAASNVVQIDSLVSAMASFAPLAAGSSSLVSKQEIAAMPLLAVNY